jgi:hypothetical protein
VTASIARAVRLFNICVDTRKDISDRLPIVMQTTEPLENHLNLKFIIEHQQQIEQSRRDIQTGVGSRLFVGGVSLIIAILTFSGFIYPPTMSQEQLFAFFGENVAAYLVPFIPYLFYSFYKGISGKIALNRLTKQQIEIDRWNVVSNNCDIEDNWEFIRKLESIQQKIDRSKQQIESAVRAGLLMGGISFILSMVFYGRPEFADAQIDVSGLVILLDIVMFFGCTFGLSKNSSTAASTILVYAIFSMWLKIPPSIFDKFPATRFETLFPIALVLSGYFFVSFYQGIVGTSTIDRLQERRSKIYEYLASERDSIDNSATSTPKL